MAAVAASARKARRSGVERSLARVRRGGAVQAAEDEALEEADIVAKSWNACLFAKDLCRFQLGV